MYDSKAITSIYLDTRRVKTDDTYPVKLRVTFQRKRKYYSILKESLSTEDFHKVMADKPRGNLRSIRYKLDEAKHDADEVIKNLKTFSFDKFEQDYFESTNGSDDVFSYYDAYIAEVKAEGRINTAESYTYSKKSLQKFCNCNTLDFDRITASFLEKYEKAMIKKGKSLTTIGIYLRCLRTIVNVALKKGLASTYPFGKGNNHYTIKNPPARKIALTTDELILIFNYDAFETKTENYFVDLWKFSYLCCGMNVKDMCNLKYSEIVRDKIYYKREKTKRSNYNGKEIIIPVSKEIKAILDKWGQKPKEPISYVFPILKRNLTPEQFEANIKQVTKQIIKYINRVAQKVGIEVRVYTYTARHSYATHLMRHGAPTLFISKQLGHSNMKTTASYLENFEERQINKWQSKVTDFNL
ncbi:MAG: site-specific integrase [Bacteroidales bacterium]